MVGIPSRLFGGGGYQSRFFCRKLRSTKKWRREIKYARQLGVNLRRSGVGLQLTVYTAMVALATTIDCARE